MDTIKLFGSVTHLAVEQFSHVGFLLSAHLVAHELAQQSCTPLPCQTAR
jgi:hypothetical protein